MPNPGTHQDDLTRITGIGARIDAKLKQAGIGTFAQLEQTSVEKLAAISGYSTQQIERKDWISQAKALAPAPPPGATSDEDLRPPGRHNFTVEVLLDAPSGAVLSSQIHHVQSGDRGSWRGWDGDRLASFIEERVGREARRTTAAGEDLPGPVAAPEKVRGPRGPSPVGFAQIRADRLLFPGSGPTIASLRLNVSQLEAHGISATAVDVEVYGQRPPFGKSRLLGRARAALRGEPAVASDVDLNDPASESQLEVFAILTFVDGTGAAPVWVDLADAELTLHSRLSRHGV